MTEAEVTAEMIEAGLREFVPRIKRGGEDPGEDLAAVYRAMRALEPPRLACRFCGVESGTVCPRNGMTIAECHDMRRHKFATDQSGHPMPSVKFWRR